ncbi:MAG TPA: cell division protein FtsA [Candidatus Kapabacteria bacterium]|nr:cell division protein FtsA [Ignavibacteria bacterium]HRK58684.1 cell division protein FtsA [Candidatus Kapabacteria bacterium]
MNDISLDKAIVGLDIGTSKVVCIIAAPDTDLQYLNILGIGIAESKGLRRGVVTNIDKTVESIRQAVERAEQQSGVKVVDVVVGIAGDHIQSFATRNIITIPSPTKEISARDVERLIDESRKINISSDRRILHVIPQEYVIDGQDGITDPIGMSGVRMEANVHVVTALVTAIQNIQRCVERAGLRMRDIVLEPLASSNSVLDADEKEIGVAVIDIGAGTTDIAVFCENIIRYSAVFGIGGQHVTDDIAKVLGILHSQAEKIKRDYGHAIQTNILNDEVIQIPGVSGRNPMEITKGLLAEIIQPRLEEIFEFAYAEIKNSGYANRLSAGIVLTGGCSLLRGAAELAQDVFGMPVKIGIPTEIAHGGFAREVENPIFATSVGLVLHGVRYRSAAGYQQTPIQNENDDTSQDKEIQQDTRITSRIVSSVKRFFNEL